MGGWLTKYITMDRSLCRIHPQVYSRGPTSQRAGSTDDNFGLIDVVVAVDDADDTESLEHLGGHGTTGCGTRVLLCYLGEENEQWVWGNDRERRTNLEELSVKRRDFSSQLADGDSLNVDQRRKVDIVITGPL